LKNAAATPRFLLVPLFGGRATAAAGHQDQHKPGRPRSGRSGAVRAPAPDQSAIPASLLNACFALFVINASFFPTAFFAHWWIFDEKGLGHPDRFRQRLVRRSPCARWPRCTSLRLGIQKQVQIAVLGQSYQGNFAWHYPPPFLFVATLPAHFPYAVAFIGWNAANPVPYLADRAVPAK
jgi:hypothetical protein